MWLEPLNANQTTYKAYYGHTPTPVNMIVSYKKQKEIVQSLLTDRDILVREEVIQLQNEQRCGTDREKCGFRSTKTLRRH